MWPKSKKVKSEDRPEPPCGDKNEHYRWEDDGWPCPLCRAEDRKRELQQKEERLATLIAQKVLEGLRKESQNEG